MSTFSRMASGWTAKALGLTTMLAIAGAPSVSDGSQSRWRSQAFKGGWAFNTIQVLGAGPNVDRCGSSVEILFAIRGVDDLGGLYTAEVDFCLDAPEGPGGRVTHSDTHVNTTYSSGDTTAMVCETYVGFAPEVDKCSRSFSRFRCSFVGGTGALEGIRGYLDMTGIESASSCDGNNDAGMFWGEGRAKVRRSGT